VVGYFKPRSFFETVVLTCYFKYQVMDSNQQRLKNMANDHVMEGKKSEAVEIWKWKQILSLSMPHSFHLPSLAYLLFPYQNSPAVGKL